MITAKLFEVLDRMTFIPVLAVRVAPYESSAFDDEKERYLLRRAGYGDPLVVLTRATADGQPAHYDPYGWHDRTFSVAHQYIADHWNTLPSGAVVDVQFILGEVDAPKVSERESAAL